MNQKEWKYLCNNNKELLDFTYYNKTRKIQKSLQYNNDPKANRIHHLRDTEEQRLYNDTYYERWRFNEDGTFEYGKYVIFVTEEWHNNYHKDSEETKQKKRVASKKKWEDPDYRESQTLAINKSWNNKDRREKASLAFTGKGNPQYGKTGELASCYGRCGELHPMYGKHHTEESRKKMSDSRIGHIVTEETRVKISASNMGHEVLDETREKISIANTGKQHTEEFKLYLSEKYTGEGNPFYGKHHTEETKEKYFIGENNPMYGKHHTEETRRIISEANKGKIVSQETRNKLSGAVSGEKNGMFGKHSDTHCADRVIELQRLASAAYKEYLLNGGTIKWQDFRREFFKLNQ